ncbi:MAG: diguanylate cyclase [Fimbriimonadaceae bacterium]|nr:diguanylate cyclase [Fimbriimonadaceae bacterium]QYK57322.1 MAG: diguanylate cyclase [Fimbriimonadaceae bacterium]
MGSAMAEKRGRSRASLWAPLVWIWVGLGTWILIVGLALASGVRRTVGDSLVVQLLVETVIFVGAVVLASIAFGRLRANLNERESELLQAEESLKEARRELEGALEVSETANATLAVASQRFQELFENIPVPCLTCDEDLNVFEINQSSIDLWGIPSHVMYLKNLLELATREVDRQVLAHQVSLAFVGQGGTAFEWHTLGQFGEERILSSRALRFGNRGGAIIASTDITEQRRYERMLNEKMIEVRQINDELVDNKSRLEKANIALEQLAATDALTALPNRRILEETMNVQWRLGKERGRSFAVLLIDVDKFKHYNDSFGHQQGDEVLRQIGSILSEAVRPGDVAGRFGGEEFMIILPDATEKEAMAVAERIRKTVASAEWPRRRVTISVGVSCFDPDYVSTSAMIEAADEALYKSKEDGRDRVTLATPPSAEAA